MSDHFSGLCRRGSLRVVDVTGQRIHDVTGKGCPVLGGKDWPCFALEVIADHKFLAITRNDQVAADPHVVAGKQQMRVRYDDLVVRHMMLDETRLRIERETLPTQ